ncbi:MAG: RNA polymerase sigma factor RpoD/SigA [Saprospiraceae bacterium]|nr:RNA polymerase sigma factor RpoD/SigA [Saprospiraceae bacterium]
MRQLKITQKITKRDSLSLDKYLNEIGKIGLINSEEEAELARMIRAGNEEALHKITRANLRFVISVAKQYQNQGLPLIDLINEGNVGLIKAAKRFDETKGFKFISYAVWWIRQSILQAIVEQSRLVRLPLNKIGTNNRINEAYQSFMQEFEREPSASEIAELVGLTEKEVRHILRISGKHVSVDAPVGNDTNGNDTMTMLDTLAYNGTTEGPEGGLMNESLKKEVKKGLESLSPKELQVISAYYGLNDQQAMTLEEIGYLCDLTRERVRQIKERAIRRLRKSTNRNNLRSYLG